MVPESESPGANSEPPLGKIQGPIVPKPRIAIRPLPPTELVVPYPELFVGVGRALLKLIS